MRKRRRLLLVILAAVVLPLAGLGVYLLTPPKPGVTLENFKRLRRWMSIPEAEGIFGQKARGPFVDSDHWAYVWESDSGERCDVTAWKVHDDASNPSSVKMQITGGQYCIHPPFLTAAIPDPNEPLFPRLRRWVKDGSGW